MPMVFPTSPIVGQVFTSGGRSWVWTGATWDSPTATNTLLAPYGLEFVKEQIVGTGVASVTVTEAFNSTYDDYLILLTGGSGSGNLSLQLGSTTTGYYAGGYINFFVGTFNGEAQSNANAFSRVARASSAGSIGIIEVFQPFVARRTFVSYKGATYETGGFAWQGSGFVDNTISYTSFILTPNVGTLTGISIKIYGYRKDA
jgi:hypothetical protein